MKDQGQAYFHPKQTQILESGTTQLLAELIADTTTHQHASLLIHQIKNNNQVQWHEVRQQLKSILVINPELMYLSDSYLTVHKLDLVTDIFEEEESVDQKFFHNQSGFLLLAITRGYLRQELPSDKLAKLKQLFAKNIKKQSSFWGLSHLQALNNYLCDSSTGYFPVFSSAQHSNQIARFDYFLSFVELYPTLFPPLMDIWSLVVKMMGCLREQRQKDRQLMNKLKSYYFGGKYHYQTTLKNMKFILQFFRNPYNEKDCLYYPQKAFNSLLEAYNEDQLVNMLQGSWLGLIWTASTIHSYFTTCIKLGITQSTSKLIMAVIRFCLKHHKYNQLLYAYENNIARLFIFLKYAKLFALTSRLLKHFIYAPTPQLTLYQKFTEKAIPLAQVISKDILPQYMQLLQTVAYRYKETTTTSDLSSVVESLLPPQIAPLTEEKMKEEVQKYSWKAQVKAKQMKSIEKQQPGLRGLINIGNSCYLNSFVQSLFMNPQFLRSVLNVSTLQLQKNKLQASQIKSQEDGSKYDPVALSKVIREDLRPLAELQRLFSLLLCSKRSEVSPLSIRNISPTQFRNNGQHDTLEFGRLFLDLIYKNDIPKLFQGELTTTIECDGCHKSRQRKQAFLDLIVSANQQGEQLKETIQHSFEDEIMEGLQCDHCLERRDKSIKRQRVSKCPQYLIVSIKRFQYCLQQKKNSKIMTKIQINPHLILQDHHYDLYSLIVHRGPSPNAGHYFSFSRLHIQLDSRWVCHNDAEVSELESYADVQQFLENNQSDTPYILFYARRDHIEARGEELSKPIVLRKALEQYVQRDFMESQKSKEKKALQLFKPFPLPFFKPDDDDDQGGPNNPSFYNNYVL